MLGQAQVSTHQKSNGSTNFITKALKTFQPAKLYVVELNQVFAFHQNEGFCIQEKFGMESYA